jgi:hypothetical protein
VRLFTVVVAEPRRRLDTRAFGRQRLRVIGELPTLLRDEAFDVVT